MTGQVGVGSSQASLFPFTTAGASAGGLTSSGLMTRMSSGVGHTIPHGSLATTTAPLISTLSTTPLTPAPLTVAASSGQANTGFYLPSHLVGPTRTAAAPPFIPGYVPPATGLTSAPAPPFLQTPQPAAPQVPAQTPTTGSAATPAPADLTQMLYKQQLRIESDVFAGTGHETEFAAWEQGLRQRICLLYTSPSPRDKRQSRMPSSA